MKDLPDSKNERGETKKHFDGVKVVDKSYLNKDFQAELEAAQSNIDGTVKQFKLNKEQERAFRIVANHTTCKDTDEQLKMYLGGMGGTGKSQVIKALMSFFDKQNEPHRFMCLAPTGSAAALLNGSTYHSVLGVNEKMSMVSDNNIANVRTKIQGVDYIFFDEVSMLSCRDMYRISSQL
ncbi:hypothetical protein PLICRDRAFT_102699, partial [Plicaturopsis crispa FD-325 SS-3]